jgi:RNAse (barnase) inhibitor barstar
MVIVTIDTRQITDCETFHSVCQAAFGFPDLYGRNMNAWIDCMTSLDAPEDGMTSVHVPEGHALALQLEHAGDFARRCPEQYEAIIECAAFVNWRRMERGRPAVLALSFFKQ